MFKLGFEIYGLSVVCLFLVRLLHISLQSLRSPMMVIVRMHGDGPDYAVTIDDDHDGDDDDGDDG